MTDPSVAKLQAEFLPCEVLQILLPEVVTGDQGTDGQGNAVLILTLEERRRDP